MKLLAAARRDPVSFRNLRKRSQIEEPEPEPETVSEPVYTSQERVTQAPASALAPAHFPSQEAAETPEVVKGYEFEKDRFVAIDPSEIRKLARSTSRDLEVTEFVHWDEIDPAYLDASYFVVPDPSAQKPYSLLYAAMKKTSFAALAQIAMHGREQILVIRYGAKGLVAHTMFYFSEVRRDQEAPAQTDGLTAKELQLAATLIQHMAGPFEPERFVDAYKQRVQALVEAKVARVPAEAAVDDAVPLSRKPPVDILDALRRSLEKASERKAPQTQTAAPTARSKRRSA